MQGRFNIQKPINVRNNSNKIKEKKHATMTNELEKAFDEIKYFFMIKTLKKLGIEGEAGAVAWSLPPSLQQILPKWQLSAILYNETN